VIRAEFAAFFHEITGPLGLSAAGYRRTRGSVEKRLGRRIRELGLSGLPAYRTYLSTHAEEWAWLDACCRITISRFWRDAALFGRVATALLPERAAAARAEGRPRLRLWSAGCASGEEAYSLAFAARFTLEPNFPDLAIEVLGTDSDPVLLDRAARAVYPAAALRELPERLRECAFELHGQAYSVWPHWRGGVRFELGDLRRTLPEGAFDLICCRNLAFTYFDEASRLRLSRSFAERLRPGGTLVLGKGEALPAGAQGLSLREPCIYVKGCGPA
jgi:chemotaxis protein methyltransferase CheR